MKTSFLIFLFFLGLTKSMFGQNQIEIEGKILDKVTKEPRPFANIYNKSSKKGTISNTDGFFKILINNVTDTIIISHIGYKQQYIEIKTDKKYYPIYQEESILLLSEITITPKDNSFLFEMIEKSKRSISNIERKSKAYYELKSFVDLMKDYRLAVNERQNAFFGKSNSVQSLFIPIKDMIKAQYGANSIEVTILESIIRKMRSSKVSRTSSDPTNPEQVKSISQSEKSYGSLTKNFNDFITVISGFESYKPSTDTLKLPSLQEMSEKLAKLNDTVSQKINQLRSVKADRLKMYDELRDRSLRIKSYVKAHYGVDSNEYNMIRLMRF